MHARKRPAHRGQFVPPKLVEWLREDSLIDARLRDELLPEIWRQASKMIVENGQALMTQDGIDEVARARALLCEALVFAHKARMMGPEKCQQLLPIVEVLREQLCPNEDDRISKVSIAKRLSVVVIVNDDVTSRHILEIAEYQDMEAEIRRIEERRLQSKVRMVCIHRLFKLDMHDYGCNLYMQ